jgi:hypothetical protein
LILRKKGEGSCTRFQPEKAALLLTFRRRTPLKRIAKRGYCKKKKKKKEKGKMKP